MNFCGIPHNGVASCEEMRSFVSIVESDRTDLVVFPKPRRVCVLNSTINDPSRSLRRYIEYVLVINSFFFRLN